MNPVPILLVVRSSFNQLDVSSIPLSFFGLRSQIHKALRVDREARRSLTGRISLERLDKLLCRDLPLNRKVHIVDLPIVVLIRNERGFFIGIHTQIFNQRESSTDEGIRPYL